MSPKTIRLIALGVFLLLLPLAIWLAPDFSSTSRSLPPDTTTTPLTTLPVQEPPCKDEHPEWRKAREIDGVKIAEAIACDPDSPYDVAFAVNANFYTIR